MEQTAEAGIDEVARDFFEAFDNRSGRRPAGNSLGRLFGKGATITRMDAGAAQVMDVAAFIEPRITLLTSGTLLDFHEWEVDSRTYVLGNIAVRCSSYQKSGFQNGAVYEGGGRKVMLLHRAGGRWLISSLLWEDD